MIRVVERDYDKSEEIYVKKAKELNDKLAKYGLISGPDIIYGLTSGSESNMIYRKGSNRIYIYILIKPEISFYNKIGYKIDHINFRAYLECEGKLKYLEAYFKDDFRSIINEDIKDIKSCDSYFDKFVNKILENIEKIKNDPRVIEAISKLSKIDIVQEYTNMIKEFISAGPDMDYNYLMEIASEEGEEEEDLIDFLNKYYKNKSLYCINSENNIIDNPIADNLSVIIPNYLEKKANKIYDDNYTVGFCEIYDLDNNHYWYKNVMGYSEVITDTKGLRALISNINKNKEVFKEVIKSCT